MEGAKLTRVALDDADLGQLVEYCEEYLNIELSSVERASRSKIITKLEAAGQKPEIIPVVERLVVAGGGDPTDALGDWDPENERWVKFRVQPGSQDDSDMPVPVAVNQDIVIFPRGVFIVCREVFYRHLIECREKRVDQDANTRFEDATRYVVDCYPSSFFGTLGYVKDGPPKRDLMHGCVFIAPRG